MKESLVPSGDALDLEDLFSKPHFLVINKVYMQSQYNYSYISIHMRFSEIMDNSMLLNYT